MSDDLVKRLRATTDGATVNPDGPEAATRIAELEAALEDARREGMEEAAQSLIEKYQSMVIQPNAPEAWRISILQDLREMAGEKPNVITAEDIDATIRAAAEEEKP